MNLYIASDFINTSEFSYKLICDLLFSPTPQSSDTECASRQVVTPEVISISHVIVDDSLRGQNEECMRHEEQL